ncbi:MAG: hypothetical protein LBN71_05465 [Tannerella sp.]|jgi:hypothetical protein|nr:hypothetical protein [Tannerella sp.]
MEVIVRDRVYYRIQQFYNNARLKYPNTYSYTDAFNDYKKVEKELAKVGTQLYKKNNTIIQRWLDYQVDYSRDTGWYFAYRVEQDTIYVYDAENARNMSDSAMIFKAFKGMKKNSPRRIYRRPPNGKF